MVQSTETNLVQKAAFARDALKCCHLCPLRCGTNRLENELGFCQLGEKAYWFRENLNYLQEIELIPSHSIYLTGCNMRCDFCSVEEKILFPNRGREWNIPELVEMVERRREQGARTLLFVGGEATVNLHAILALLAALPTLPRIVWDSNMYLTEEARVLLEGVVDVYAGDLKFSNNACARRISHTPRYMEEMAHNLRFAEETASLIVRHLLLPGHLECCVLPMMDWLRENLRTPRLSLRKEYIPPEKPMEYRSLSGYVSNKDYELAVRAAEENGIELVP